MVLGDFKQTLGLCCKATAATEASHKAATGGLRQRHTRPPGLPGVHGRVLATTLFEHKDVPCHTHPLAPRQNQSGKLQLFGYILWSSRIRSSCCSWQQTLQGVQGCGWQQ
jgi:hypothetical protein